MVESRTDLKRLAGALLDAFPTAHELVIFVRWNMGVDPEEVLNGRTLEAAAVNLIKWAEDHERLRDLMDTALKAKPNNAALQAYADQIHFINQGEKEIDPNFNRGINIEAKRELVILLATAFPTPAELDRLTDLYLGARLSAIPSQGTDIQALALGVINWCLSQGGDMLKQLLEGAVEERPYRDDLRKLMERLKPPA